MLPVSNYRQNTLATGKDRLDFDKCTKVRDVQQRFGASHKPMFCYAAPLDGLLSALGMP